MVRHFYHILLIDHHAVGFAENLLHFRDKVFAPLRVAVPRDKLLHHSALGNPGPYHRACRCEHLECVNIQTGKQRPHPRRLDVKAADRPSPLYYVERFRILKEEVVVENVKVYPCRFPWYRAVQREYLCPRLRRQPVIRHVKHVFVFYSFTGRIEA